MSTLRPHGPVADIEIGQLERLHGGGEPYFMALPTGGFQIDYDDASHEYRLNGEKVTSVTQILDRTIPKPALTWWGFRVGLAGVLRALQENAVSLGALTAWEWEPVISPARHPGHPDIPERRKGNPRTALEALVVGELKHSPNHIKEEKGTLGTSVHNAAETLALTSRVPPIDDFPELDRGYLQALARFWVDHDPDVKLSEVIVASWTHRYAGRFDAILQCASLGRARIDYKTSGGIYAEYDVQQSLYDLAQAEMYAQTGDERWAPVDGSYLVHLRPTGDYEVVRCTINHADALLELAVMRQREDRDARVKALGRKP